MLPRVRAAVLAFAAMLGLAVPLGVAWASAAPEAPPAHAADAAAYRRIAQLPDWSGAWLADPRPSPLKTDSTIPFTPDFAAKLSELRQQVKAGGKEPGNPLCRPYGLPLFMSHSGPLYEFLVTPSYVFIDAGNQEARNIHTDGRGLPAQPKIDGFNGYSIGHWEGDTLVVDTDGILNIAELVPGIPNGGGLRANERIHLVGPNKLADEITLTSLKALTKPWTYTTTFTRHREWAVSEDVCITPSHAVYRVEGYHPTHAQLIASTTLKPPVRQPAPPTAAKPPSADDWTALAKLPDWSGWWEFDFRPNEIETGEFIPLNALREKYMQKLYAIRKVGGDTPSDIYHCRPRGAPQMMKAAGSGFLIAFTPGQVTMIPNNSQIRRFYTDGRGHPDPLELSFNGHSIAHWEGDTLVVDTVGIRPDVQMFYGMPAGDGLHLVERYHLSGPDKLEIDSTQEDPSALTASWSYMRSYSRHRDWDLLEDYCSQNNRDVGPQTGMQQFDLTPPPELQNQKP